MKRAGSIKEKEFSFLFVISKFVFNGSNLYNGVSENSFRPNILIIMLLILFRKFNYQQSNNWHFDMKKLILFCLSCSSSYLVFYMLWNNSKAKMNFHQLPCIIVKFFSKFNSLKRKCFIKINDNIAIMLMNLGFIMNEQVFFYEFL